MADKTLLKNGIVLTLDKKVGNFHKADVLIDGAKIAAVGPNLNAEGAEVIDYTLSLHDALPIVGRASCRERVYFRTMRK